MTRLFFQQFLSRVNSGLARVSVKNCFGRSRRPVQAPWHLRFGYWELWRGCRRQQYRGLSACPATLRADDLANRMDSRRSRRLTGRIGRRAVPVPDGRCGGGARGRGCSAKRSRSAQIRRSGQKRRSRPVTPMTGRQPSLLRMLRATLKTRRASSGEIRPWLPAAGSSSPQRTIAHRPWRRPPGGGGSSFPPSPCDQADVDVGLRESRRRSGMSDTRARSIPPPRGRPFTTITGLSIGWRVSAIRCRSSANIPRRPCCSWRSGRPLY